MIVLASAATVQWVILTAAFVWVAGALAVSGYGSERGYPVFPILLCALLLGWPLVLLGVVIGEGPRAPKQG